METDKLKLKDQYTNEETLDIIRETLYQINTELDKELQKLEDRIEEETDPLIKAGIKRKKTQVKRDKTKIRGYFIKTTDTLLTECCDAPVERYAMRSRGICTECNQDMPDLYQKETKLKDLIKKLNEKIEEENQE